VMWYSHWILSFLPLFELPMPWKVWDGRFWICLSTLKKLAMDESVSVEYSALQFNKSKYISNLTFALEVKMWLGVYSDFYNRTTS
jgi:hypothetical protein